MRLKRYEHNEVASAVKQARTELGDEAMLISVERASTEVGIGRYRVIFAAESATGAQKLPRLANNGQFQNGNTAKGDVSKWHLVELELRELAGDLSRSPSENTTAKEVGDSLLEHAGRRWIDDQTLRLHPVTPPLIEVLVGPRNNGKSTAAVKLASRQVSAGKKVALAHLFKPENTFASELGSNGVIECCAQSIDHLDTIVDVEPSMESIIVDITGAAGEMMNPLLRWLTKRRAVVHLTLNARATPEAWFNAGVEFSSFMPGHLLLTHVDQITDWASVWRGIGGTGLPCSYFSAGPRVSSPLEFIGLAKNGPIETGKAASA